MAWLRVDDHEALDSKVGQLDDALYRARQALMQLVAREYRDTGLFPRASIVHAVYSTPKGPKALTKPGLARLYELGFVREESDYTIAELEDLGLEWPRVGDWMRIHNWEKFNPPRDRTNAERQQRLRERRHDEDNALRNGVTNGDDNGPSHTRPRARPRPVPSPRALAQSPTHSQEGHESPDSNGQEHALQLLHIAVGVTEENLTKLKRAARGCSEAHLHAAREAAQGPGVNDPLAVALSELKKSRTRA